MRPSGRARRGRATRVAGTVLATVVTLGAAGCSGDTAEPAGTASPTPTTNTPDPSSSPSVTVPAAAAERPERPRARRDTLAAREAFARFVVASWSYALATNEAEVLTGLSPRGRPCDGCDAFRRELAQREEQGWFVDFPGVEIREVVVRRSAAPGTSLASATVDIPASQSRFEDGAVRNNNRARDNVRFDVTLGRAGQRYVLVAFSLR